MVESTNPDKNNEQLPDYEEYELFDPDAEAGAAGAQAEKAGASVAKPSDYVGVHSTSFKDMLLKPELQ